MISSSSPARPAREDPGEWIERGARERPGQLFLQTPDGQRMTYAQLRERSGDFMRALVARGVIAGDRVAVRVEKSPEAILLYVACLRLGALYVPINVLSSLNEVAYFLRDATPRLLVVQPEEESALRESAREASVESVETLSAAGTGSLAELARGGSRGLHATIEHDAHAPAVIVYTSGTTGRSKGAVLTRANLASNAAVLVETWQFTERDVLLHVLPLFHVHGLFAALNTVLASGSTCLLLAKFDAGSVLRHFAASTVFMGVPTHYTRLLQEPNLSGDTTRNMRLFVSGSAPLLAETHREFRRRTGHTILERYGMTETLMNTSNPYEGARVPGSVGPPLAGVEVRVTNRETGEVELATDAVGALEIRGPNVFAGYWQDPQKTRSEFTADGWFKTGDVGRIDASGYVFIMGRAKDLVISGGYNVYPKEVETQLDAMPGVAESAVFGLPHPDLGEAVTAAVVLKPEATLSEAEIMEAVRPHLARYKAPKRILLIETLPRNTMGKVQKNLLRETYSKLYTS